MPGMGARQLRPVCCGCRKACLNTPNPNLLSLTGESGKHSTLSAQGRVFSLPDVWIRPPLGGKGRKMTGQLEAHANGFRYTSPKGEVLDLMYRCVTGLA